jgi:hypothetical protein
VPTDAGIETRTVATSALAVRGGESNKKDAKMINLAGFVEELIEVGKVEGVCWDGRFYLFAAVEGRTGGICGLCTPKSNRITGVSCTHTISQ